MIDLKKTSGLDLKVDEKNFQLIFGDGLMKVKPEVRMVSQMIDVIRTKKIKASEKLYYIYRDIKRKKDTSLFGKYRLRYDFTIIKPGKIGDEFIKTFGHYHPQGYCEIYEVLHGSALYLIQKVDFSNLENQMVKDVFAIKSKAKDKVIIPSSYGHLTYNIGKEILVEANLLSADFENIYEPIRKAKGEVYFSMADGQFLPNKNYKNIPPLKIKKPSSLEELGFRDPLYLAFVKNPQKFSFLRPSRQE